MAELNYPGIPSSVVDFYRKSHILLPGTSGPPRTSQQTPGGYQLHFQYNIPLNPARATAGGFPTGPERIQDTRPMSKHLAQARGALRENHIARTQGRPLLTFAPLAPQAPESAHHIPSTIKSASPPDMPMGTRPAFNSAQPTLKRKRKETGLIHLQGPPQTKHTRLPARRVFFETTTPTELIAHSRGEHAEICEGVEKLIITKEQRKGVRSQHTIQDGPNRPLCSIQKRGSAIIPHQDTQNAKR
ncbi:hypothetical protein B0H14DRAFT_3125509, partial [Mycena olivaceomarginata]